MIAPVPAPVWSLRPSEADIASATSFRELHDGRRYARQNRVSELERSEDGGEITARTRGSRPQPYRQHVRLERDAEGALQISGTCSCPVGYNCKHVAAVLVAARERWPRAPIVQLPRPHAERPVELTPDLLGWLSDLQQAAKDDTDDYPEEVRHRLFYVFKAEARGGRTPVLGIGLLSAAQLKKGGLGRAAVFSLRSSASHSARFLRPIDRRIIEKLSYQVWDESLVPAILSTGRARLGGVEGPALREGPPRAGRISWTLNEGDGAQTPVLEVEGAAVAAMTPHQPPMPPGFWYIDEAENLIGPIALDISAAVAGRLLAAPAVPPTLAVALRERLTATAPAALPLPRELPPPEPLKGPPVPVLRLTTGEMTLFQRWQYEQVRVPVARLAFRYGPLLINGREQTAVRGHGGRLYSVARDQATERTAFGVLQELGFESLPQSGLFDPGADKRTGFILPEPEDWLLFISAAAPKLRTAGWDIEAEADFPIRLVEPEDDVTAEFSEGSGIDWLELHLGVTVGGERIDLVPVLAEMIANMTAEVLASLAETADDGEIPFLAPLPDGRLLALKMASIRPVMLALFELFNRGTLDPKAPKISLTRHDAADIAALEEAAAGLVWKGGEALRALGRQLREAGDTIPRAALPAGFNATLRPYQSGGVDWLQMLNGAGLGGVLADDMGLGKTVQTLAHLAIEKAEGRLDCPALIVCPTSLVPNWTSEAARFAPELRVLVLHGLARKQHFGAIAEHDVVITTYALLPRDAEVLHDQQWHVLVLDEAQNVKNPLAETRRVARLLKARQRLCLSGTPLENHLGELWSLFDIVAPGFLGAQDQFRRAWRTPIEKKHDEQRRDMLARRVRPFLLRRTKEQVAPDLPPKTEIVERIDLDTGQRAIYDSVRLAMHKRVRDAIAAKGLAQSGIIILDALLKMRQACCDPRLLKLEAAKRAKAGSAKLERLMELLPVLLEEGRSVLLFSQFTSMLALIEAQLRKQDVGYELLTGDTKDRRTPIARFQAGKARLFLLSLKAGGTGLNLTAADTVIHYDPWWNPAVEAQATDRAHRIGQDKPVFVHRLVTTDTIEEKMEELKARKRALVDGILNGTGSGALSLTEADVEELFA